MDVRRRPRGRQVRVNRRWSAGLGVGYSMLRLGTSVTPPVRDPTSLRPAPDFVTATSWSAVAEVHHEPR
jgi:hypothetical protein